MIAQSLRLLLVEDSATDALLIVRELTRAGFNPTWQRVDNEMAYLEHLHPHLDLVLSDHSMPQFTAFRAIELLEQTGYNIPLIIISGTIGEDVAVQGMRLGAKDYLLKDRLARLGPAVRGAIQASRSERERARLEAETRLFRTLLDRSEDTFEIIDPDSGRFLDVSGHGLDRLGYSREEFLGLSITDVESAIARAGWPATIRELRQTGTVAGEGTHRCRDGTTFPSEYRARLVRLDRDYILAVVRDISVRRQAERALQASEERFRELADNIHEVFWSVNPATGQVLYVSPAFLHIWGRPCSSLYADPALWLNSIHAEDRARIRDRFAAGPAAGPFDEEYRILRPDGTERWIRARAFPVLGAGGALVRVVGIAGDITDAKRIQGQFLRAQRLEAIGTLAGGIAHDLNNILFPVLMGPALLRETARTDHERQLLDMIEQAARRGSNVVRQLLTFSRGGGGELMSVQLRHLIQEMVDIIRETFPRNIEIETDVRKDLEPVLGDPTQLHQVIMNLCVNARDAMPQGGRLVLSAWTADLAENELPGQAGQKAGPYTVVRIADNGEGIQPGILGLIFEPFFTTKPATKGTGLGLSTVRSIVHGHSGFITVASTPGQGATFTVSVPASRAVDLPRPPVVRRAAAPPNHPLILIVDDEADTRTMMQLVLKPAGYRILSAENGEEGFAAYSRNCDQVRLVITDGMMPVMGGAALIRALRAADPNLKILVTSGVIDEVASADLTAARPDLILSKPYPGEELLNAVNTLLSGG